MHRQIRPFIQAELCRKYPQWQGDACPADIFGGDILLTIDEYQNLSVKEGAVLRDTLAILN